ncbi:MAG TPA: hypothetical protein PLI16_01305 [Bacteroidales bacterium]|jgi:hypothetical protein|nr:hypothetical protein [Bacteroidales bacterium]HNZ43394.1 hypothetical protein [Bacteroidales bacterium]HOH83226.1 hypothetical protein [Bacteroidales bacterium]HPB26103.1 hypothetical protein [Bacteroidales bacterium]
MKKNLSCLAIFIAVFVFIFSSCKKDNTDDPPATVKTGYVTGKVIAKNGTTPIPNASIFVDADGEIYITKSTLDGSFTLQAPIGEQVLNIQTGGGNIFRAQYPVSIAENQTTTVPSGTLKLLQADSLAYIHGLYDNIQVLIQDSLGYSVHEIFVSDLSNLSLLETFGAIFLNCGKQGVMDSIKYQNLLTYVQNGGSLYASDWAVEYLTGDGNYKSTGHAHEPYGIKATCPNGLPGGFIADSTLCTTKSGPATMVNNAQIVAQDLIDYLGINTINIEYDLGAWEVIELIDIPWEILIQDNNTYGPLAARIYPAPSPNKSIQRMLDQGWVTICHIPPGNPANAHTITISVNALPAHLAHGDFVGSCESVGYGGVIYYTTFHNEVQHNISNDVQHILQYFILNM